MKRKSSTFHLGTRSGHYWVVCKCPAPNCGRLHVELWDVNPIIMPRRYCRVHAYMRGDDGDGVGYMLEKRTGFRKAKS